MKVTHKSRYNCRSVEADTAQYITTNCNTITFDNVGDDDATITCDFEPENYFFLPAGKSVTLGGRKDSILVDNFSILFADLAANKKVNVIKEIYQLA